MKRYILPIALACICIPSAKATPDEKASLPEEAGRQELRLKAAPTASLLMDGAVYTSNEKETFPAGVAVPEARIGVKAFYGKWDTKVEVGVSYGKLSLKDIYLRHTFNDHHQLRLGYFIHQFGLQSASGSSMKISMEEPMANEAMSSNRLLGAMYLYEKGDYYTAASLYAESKAMTFNTAQMRRTGYGGMTRLAWRPLRGENSRIAQAGISFQAGTPQFNGDPDNPDNHIFSVAARFPTRVARAVALGAQVHDVNSMFRFTPELLLAGGPLALEGQYYYMQLQRRDGLPGYKAQGAYGMLRCLAIGGDYSYSEENACIATPAPKSLELVLGYNYTNTTDAKAGIYGGRASDLSLTANWYINKYMIWRMRAAYTYRFDRMDYPDTHLGSLQTRLQIII